MKNAAARLRKTVSMILCLLLVTLLLAAVSEAQRRITACGTTITEWGNYILANDLQCSGFGIRINARLVALNLDRHTITGNNSDTGISIGNSVVSVFGHGTISNFAIGIAVQAGAEDAHLQLFSATNNTIGIQASQSIRPAINDVTADNNSEAGILITGSQNGEIAYSEALSNGQYGIAIENSFHNLIFGNRAERNGMFDIYLSSCDDHDDFFDNVFRTSNQRCIH